MAQTARRYQAGYRDPITDEWVVGTSEDPNLDTGYYDMELEIWVEGVPDISSGEWMPEFAVLATARECPTDFPIKGNLPSRITCPTIQPMSGPSRRSVSRVRMPR